jgi:hypothetical protein
MPTLSTNQPAIFVTWRTINAAVDGFHSLEGVMEL